MPELRRYEGGMALANAAAALVLALMYLTHRPKEN